MKKYLKIVIGIVFITTLNFAGDIGIVPKPQFTKMMDGGINISSNLHIESNDEITNEIIKNQNYQ